MDACLRCQSETKVDCRGGKDCVVVWGECNHSFHQCCMSLGSSKTIGARSASKSGLYRSWESDLLCDFRPMPTGGQHLLKKDIYSHKMVDL